MKEIYGLTVTQILENNDCININDKQSIQYVVENTDLVMNIIKKTLASKKYHKQLAADELYSDLIHQLSKSPDYTFEKACQGKRKAFITLEDFIRMHITFCIKDKITEVMNYSNAFIDLEGISNEDNDKSLVTLETLPDQNAITDAETLESDITIDKVLNDLRFYRYEYGVDLYLILYLKYLTSDYNIDFRSILEMLGIDYYQFEHLEKQFRNIPLLRTLVKMLANLEIEVALSKLEKYVYSKHTIKKTLYGIYC